MAEPGAENYSRRDDAFAQELVTGLELTGFEPYLDKHNIAAGEDWEARLGRLIEGADTVVFIISPDSVASERCAWEVVRTEALKKRRPGRRSAAASRTPNSGQRPWRSPGGFGEQALRRDSGSAFARSAPGWLTRVAVSQTGQVA